MALVLKDEKQVCKEILISNLVLGLENELKKECYDVNKLKEIFKNWKTDKNLKKIRQILYCIKDK